MVPSGTKICLVAGNTDMRNGFNGLAAKVQTTLKDDPMSGHVFIFRERNGSQVKLLWSTAVLRRWKPTLTSCTLTGRVDDPAVQRTLRQTRTRKLFPESRLRNEKRLLSAEPCCPDCGGALSYPGEDIAEQLELLRRAFRVIRTVREKHACTQYDAIVQAPAPSRPIERGIVGPGLLACVLNSKYAEHTPLYRQSEIYSCQGVELSRSLLSGWVDACCRIIRKRRPGGCGHTLVMTATPDRRWHRRCGSPIVRTEKGSTRSPSCRLQRCAAGGCVRRVQRAVPR